MKIAGVSIWIWSIGLIVVASGIITATSVFSEKSSQTELHDVDPKLNTIKTFRSSNHSDTGQPNMSKGESGNEHRGGGITSSFLPSGLGDWRLGMGLSDFKKAVPGLDYEVFGDFRITTTKINPCKDVVEITAYFDMSSENLLYELIVKYSTGDAFDRAFGLVMNNPKWQDAWLISLTDCTYVRAWSFDNTFVYKYLGAGPEHEEAGMTTAKQLQERRILKLLK